MSNDQPLKPGETEIRTMNMDGSLDVMRGAISETSVNISQPSQNVTDYSGNIVDTIYEVQTSIVSLKLFIMTRYTVKPDGNSPKRSKIITDIRKKLGLG